MIRVEEIDTLKSRLHVVPYQLMGLAAPEFRRSFGLGICTFEEMRQELANDLSVDSALASLHFLRVYPIHHHHGTWTRQHTARVVWKWIKTVAHPIPKLKFEYPTVVSSWYSDCAVNDDSDHYSAV